MTNSIVREPEGWIAKLSLNAALLLGKTGFSGIRAGAGALGALFWACLPSRRRLAEQNIFQHLGFLEQHSREVARTSFTQNAQSFLECVLTPEFGLDSPHLRIAQPDLFNRMYNERRPVVAATAHLGAWELLSSILGDFPADRPRYTVVRRYKNIVMHTITTYMRSSHGSGVLGHREAVFPVLRALKKNGVVAFLVDHNTSQSEAVFLPFLGEEAAVNKGPALLAVRAQAMIWPICLLREANGGYAMHLQEPLDTAALEGTIEERTEAAAIFYTRAMERFVRQAPEQWFWMHNRWKTKRPEKDAE